MLWRPRPFGKPGPYSNGAVFPEKKNAAGEVLTLAERANADRVPYDAWGRDGYIHTTPGKAVKYGFVGETSQILQCSSTSK